MRSDYTSNGMHKDDPTNPESYWNDWSIDRDGNTLKEYKPKNKKLEKDIRDINDDIKILSIKMNIALLNKSSEKELNKICEDLLNIVVKQNKLIEELTK